MIILYSPDFSHTTNTAANVRYQTEDLLNILHNMLGILGEDLGICGKWRIKFPTQLTSHNGELYNYYKPYWTCTHSKHGGQTHIMENSVSDFTVLV